MLNGNVSQQFSRNTENYVVHISSVISAIYAISGEKNFSPGIYFTRDNFSNISNLRVNNDWWNFTD